MCLTSLHVFYFGLRTMVEVRAPRGTAPLHEIYKPLSDTMLTWVNNVRAKQEYRSALERCFFAVSPRAFTCHELPKRRNPEHDATFRDAWRTGQLLGRPCTRKSRWFGAMDRSPLNAPSGARADVPGRRICARTRNRNVGLNDAIAKLTLLSGRAPSTTARRDQKTKQFPEASITPIIQNA
jgi:hypothetical protein